MSETDEQLVQHVLSSKCYYKMLRIQKNASNDEIRVAYKKLALRLHPDKNQHHKAEEAFKAVGKAYATLNDAQKRQTYDHHGEEGVKVQENGGTPGASHRGGGFRTEDDILFQMFEEMFGPGFAPRRRQYAYQHRPQEQHQRQQQQHHGNQHHHQHHNMHQTLFMQLLGMFMLILVYMMSSGALMGESTPGYSLTQEGTYTQSRTTKTMGSIRIKYYVEPNFQRKYGNDGYTLRQVEREVLSTQISYLERVCVVEQIEELRTSVSEERKLLKSAREDDDVSGVRIHKKRLDDFESDYHRLNNAYGGASGGRQGWGGGFFELFPTAVVATGCVLQNKCPK
eukprot:PhF_6_TR43683/c0_g1_i1/m.67135/K09518/DNAJB12; DnaJ homolog subfamily B member 12